MTNPYELLLLEMDKGLDERKLTILRNALYSHRYRLTGQNVDIQYEFTNITLVDGEMHLTIVAKGLVPFEEVVENTSGIRFKTHKGIDLKDYQERLCFIPPNEGFHDAIETNALEEVFSMARVLGIAEDKVSLKIQFIKAKNNEEQLNEIDARFSLNNAYFIKILKTLFKYTNADFILFLKQPKSQLRVVIIQKHVSINHEELYWLVSMLNISCKVDVWRDPLEHTEEKFFAQVKSFYKIPFLAASASGEIEVNELGEILDDIGGI
jgi:hypothetical protein